MKILFLAWVKNFWKSGFACKYSTRRTFKTWYTEDSQIECSNFENFYFWPKSGSQIEFLAVFLPKGKIFKIATSNLWNATGKLHYKFQVPSMFAVQMNVPFVSFQYRDFKALHVLYLQANPHFGPLKFPGPPGSREFNKTTLMKLSPRLFCNEGMFWVLFWVLIC